MKFSLAGGYKIHVGRTLGEGPESWLFRYVFVLLSIVYGLMNTQKREPVLFPCLLCVLLCVLLVLINHC
jgi:hypothetical protein